MGLLVVVLVIVFAPATTQGTTTIRLVAITSPSDISHLYIQVSNIQLHGEGLPQTPAGWTTVSQTFPVVDLLSPIGLSAAQTISSVAVHSGRYDAIRISFTNSTIVIPSARSPRPSITAPPPLLLNATLFVTPNGVSDVMVSVAFDYASLLTTTPILSFVLVKGTTV